MPRARDAYTELDPAIQHFLVEGCAGSDPPAENALEWFRLLHPRPPDDLRPLRELWAAHRDALERHVRDPWVVRALEGRTPQRPIECPMHQRQRQAALRAELERLARAEAEQLAEAREVEAHGPIKGAVTAVRQSFAQRRLWLEREATLTDPAPGAR